MTSEIKMMGTTPRIVKIEWSKENSFKESFGVFEGEVYKRSACNVYGPSYLSVRINTKLGREWIANMNELNAN